jgi:dipeptide/tripeptide permease
MPGKTAGHEASNLSGNQKLTYGSLSDQKAPLNPRVVAASGLPAVCICILAVELCERLAFYTFTGTQESFLEKMGYTLSQAGGLNAAVGTLCMTWALFAGWMADCVLGRYHTILYFGLIYAFGSVVAAAGAFPLAESSRWYLTGVMVLVPIGTAGIKANISNFGADQYDVSDPAQAAAQEKFFSWFYLSINLGSAVAYGYLTTMGSNGGLGVPQKFGYFAVYAISALCMLGAVFLFSSQKSKYKMSKPQERSSLGAVNAFVMASIKAGSKSAAVFATGMVLLSKAVVLSVAQAIMPEASFAPILTILAFVFAGVGMLAVVATCLEPSWVVDVPNESLSAAEVSGFLRLLPILFTANLAFSSLYNSMQFWYQQQACQMDLRIPGAQPGAQFAGSFFMIADCLSIVLATPFAIDYLNPYLERITGNRFGHGAKFGLGMSFGLLSVLVAAHFEMVRKQMPVLDMVSNCAATGVHMTAFSSAWMTIPFFLMGLGEIYTQPVLMQFAYRESPPSMRTLTAATGLVVGAVSTALFTAQVAALSKYVPNDLNEGHLEYGYLSNIILGAILYGVYLSVLKYYEEHAPKLEDAESIRL